MFVLDRKSPYVPHAHDPPIFTRRLFSLRGQHDQGTAKGVVFVNHLKGKGL